MAPKTPSGTAPALRGSGPQSGPVSGAAGHAQVPKLDGQKLVRWFGDIDIDRALTSYQKLPLSGCCFGFSTETQQDTTPNYGSMMLKGFQLDFMYFCFPVLHGTVLFFGGVRYSIGMYRVSLH